MATLGIMGVPKGDDGRTQGQKGPENEKQQRSEGAQVKENLQILTVLQGPLGSQVLKRLTLKEFKIQ